MKLQTGRCFSCQFDVVLVPQNARMARKIICSLFWEDNMKISLLEKEINHIDICPVCNYQLELLRSTAENFKENIIANACGLCGKINELLSLDLTNCFRTLIEDYKLSIKDKLCSTCLFYLSIRHTVKDKLLKLFPKLEVEKTDMKNLDLQKVKRLKPLVLNRKINISKAVAQDSKLLHQIPFVIIDIVDPKVKQVRKQCRPPIKLKLRQLNQQQFKKFTANGEQNGTQDNTCASNRNLRNKRKAEQINLNVESPETHEQNKDISVDGEVSKKKKKRVSFKEGSDEIINNQYNEHETVNSGRLNQYSSCLSNKNEPVLEQVPGISKNIKIINRLVVNLVNVKIPNATISVADNEIENDAGSEDNLDTSGNDIGRNDVTGIDHMLVETVQDENTAGDDANIKKTVLASSKLNEIRQSDELAEVTEDNSKVAHVTTGEKQVSSDYDLQTLSLKLHEIRENNDDKALRVESGKNNEKTADENTIKKTAPESSDHHSKSTSLQLDGRRKTNDDNEVRKVDNIIVEATEDDSEILNQTISENPISDKKSGSVSSDDDLETISLQLHEIKENNDDKALKKISHLVESEKNNGKTVDENTIEKPAPESSDDHLESKSLQLDGTKKTNDDNEVTKVDNILVEAIEDDSEVLNQTTSENPISGKKPGSVSSDDSQETISLQLHEIRENNVDNNLKKIGHLVVESEKDNEKVVDETTSEKPDPESSDDHLESSLQLGGRRETDNDIEVTKPISISSDDDLESISLELNEIRDTSNEAIKIGHIVDESIKKVGRGVGDETSSEKPVPSSSDDDLEPVTSLEIRANDDNDLIKISQEDESRVAEETTVEKPVSQAEVVFQNEANRTKEDESRTDTRRTENDKTGFANSSRFVDTVEDCSIDKRDKSEASADLDREEIVDDASLIQKDNTQTVTKQPEEAKEQRSIPLEEGPISGESSSEGQHKSENGDGESENMDFDLSDHYRVIDSVEDGNKNGTRDVEPEKHSSFSVESIADGSDTETIVIEDEATEVDPDNDQIETLSKRIIERNADGCNNKKLLHRRASIYVEAIDSDSETEDKSGSVETESVK